MSCSRSGSASRMSTPVRQVSDRLVRLPVDAGRQEPLEAVPRGIDDAEGRVASLRQLGGDLDEALEQRVEREL